MFGDTLEHAVVQHRGDLLPIQKGWAHTVVNLSLTTPIRAYEFRATTTVVLDNPLLPQLQPIAHRRGREYLLDLHGHHAVELFRPDRLHPTSEVDGRSYRDSR